MKTGALVLLATLALASSHPAVAQTSQDTSSQQQTQPATTPADQVPAYDQQAAPDQPQAQPGDQQQATPVTTQEQPAMTDESAAATEAPSSTAADEQQELPKTASSLPLLALIGIIGMLAAVGLRLARQKSRA